MIFTHLIHQSNIKEINTPWGPGKTATLPDGRTVTVRPGSSEGKPTLEVLKGKGAIKIRYE